ncbi:hypothetical protein N8633_02545, partial [bacterium]|nr:hypothetical protein [bacterium]
VEEEQRSVSALWDRGPAFSPKIGKTVPRFQTHPLKSPFLPARGALFSVLREYPFMFKERLGAFVRTIGLEDRSIN